MNSEISGGRRRLRKRVLITLLTCAVAVTTLTIIGPFVLSKVWERRVHRALVQMRLKPSQESCDQLLQILQQQQLNQELGNAVLKEILKPKLQIRDKYLVGKPVLVGVDHEWIVNARDSILGFSYTVVRGKATLQQFKTMGALKHGQPNYIEFIEGLDREGALRPLVQEGRFSGGLLFEYELSPGSQHRWIWPSREPFPWSLLPEKVNASTSQRHGMTYKCRSEAPFDIVLASRHEMPSIRLLSNAELDRQMKASFRAEQAQFSSRHEHASNLPQVNFVYYNLPENVAFRAKFVESSGKEYFSQSLSLPRKSGTTGFFYAGEFGDLFASVPVGEHSGSLVLFTDPEGVYLLPETLSNIWSGSLAFPLEFKVEKGTR